MMSEHVAAWASFRFSIWLCLVMAVPGCAVKQAPLEAELFSSGAEAGIYVLARPVVVRTSRSADTTLKAGTKWTIAGRISQGVVMTTTDQVVIVNSFNVHEGYIVVDEEQMVGFYLPVEKTFVESKPVSIQFEPELIQGEIR